MPGIVTLQSRMRRAHDWMNTDLSYRFIGIGRTSPWSDENNPPYPAEDTTEVTELIGLQRIDSYKYAKVISNPTTLQKKTATYYKGLYYETTQDYNVALEDGYTDIICKVTLDRDTISAIPVDITYRQVGLYVGVNATEDEIKYGITREQWDNKSSEDKGMLEVVDNRGPISRSDDQAEEIYIMLSF